MSGNLLYRHESSISPHQPAVIVTDSDHISSAGRRVEPWEVAFYNGGAIMDEIPMPNRDIHEQLAFRSNQSGTTKNEANEQLSEVIISYLLGYRIFTHRTFSRPLNLKKLAINPQFSYSAAMPRQLTDAPNQNKNKNIGYLATNY